MISCNPTARSNLAVLLALCGGFLFAFAVRVLQFYTLLSSSRAVLLQQPFLLTPFIHQLKKEAPEAGSPGTYPESVVPGARAEGGAVGRDPQGADTVLMSEQNGHTGPLQHIPDIDGVIVIAREQQATCREKVLHSEG